MQTSIVINDDLMSQALDLTGLKTKREAVEEGLRLLVQLKRQEKIQQVRGKFHWDDNLDEMRTDG